MIGAHGAPVYAVAVSPDGSRITSAGADGELRVWDTGARPDGRPLFLSDQPGSVQAVASSPDGARLVSGGDDGRLRVWTLAAGSSQEPLMLSGHRGQVRSVAFSPDGRSILSAGEDRAVRLTRCDECGPLPVLIADARSKVARELSAVERANFLGE